MALTFAQMVTRVEKNTNRSDGDEETHTKQFLNEALREVARRHDWRDLAKRQTATLTEDDHRFPFPSDMMVCHSLRIIDGTSSRLLIQKSIDAADEWEPYVAGTTSQKPYTYAIDGNYFEFEAPLNDDYECRIRFTKFPELMTNDADEAEITDIDDVLVAYATAELFRFLSQHDEAAQWDVRFERGFARARLRDGDRPDWNPTRHGVTDGVTHRGNYWNDPTVMG